MLISDVTNKDELSSLVLAELKEFGVKFRKEKKNKNTQEKCCQKIFRMPLSALELTDVVLANGGIVQIPKFVADACQRVLEQVETEGLFRKAGSASRQRDIKVGLEAGLPLGRSHHVIDIANVLKLFFRELPEPLIPPNIQEPLLRCLVAGEKGIKPLLMSCLLLSAVNVNTLAFFMQFLHTVSLCSDRNKMTIENLAILFTPGLMPIEDISNIRFTNHVKVVRVLIEQSELIGVLPDSIVGKLTTSATSTTAPLQYPKTPCDADKKKKKRRSGMLNGLKKFVGAIGSSENLDSTPEQHEPVTPCLNKSTKKRKLVEVSAFSAKKKKELLGLFPENGGILPNTPFLEKENKKTRISLGGRKVAKSSSTASTSGSTTMERRWSFVGPGWNKKKGMQEESKNASKVPLSPVASMPCISRASFQESDPGVHHMETEPSDYSNPAKSASESSNYDYVRISKSEYEAIKDRVAAIETRISQEFGSVQDCILRSSVSDLESSLSGPEKVLNKFDKTVEETGPITSPRTEQLAKRLSRELKIRRSEDHRIIRSPSARKIGTMRRRSRENVKLARNKTWHIADSKLKQLQTNADSMASGISFYPKSNLKRGRPNTVFTGLHQPGSITKVELSDLNEKCFQPEEQWTSAEMFFNNPPGISGRRSSGFLCNPAVETAIDIDVDEPDTPVKKRRSDSQTSQTPRYVTTINLDEAKTPMLPPRSAVRKTSTVKSQARLTKTSNSVLPQIHGILPEDGQQGRASIARLRSQNAGMVLAKAKLFDGLGTESEKVSKQPVRVVSNESRRQSSTFVNKINSHSDANNCYIVPYKTLLANMPKEKMTDIKTARRKALSKSPGFTQKRQHSTTVGKDLPQHNRIDKFELFRKTPNIIIHRELTVNSPRRVRTPRGQPNVGVRRTPLKATAIGTRCSPRLKLLQQQAEAN